MVQRMRVVDRARLGHWQAGRVVARVEPGQHPLLVGQSLVELDFGQVSPGEHRLVPGHGRGQAVGLDLRGGRLQAQLQSQPVAQHLARRDRRARRVLQVVARARLVGDRVLQPGMGVVEVVGGAALDAVKGLQQQAVAHVVVDAVVADEAKHGLRVLDQVCQLAIRASIESTT